MIDRQLLSSDLDQGVLDGALESRSSSDRYVGVYKRRDEPRIERAFGALSARSSRSKIDR